MRPTWVEGKYRSHQIIANQIASGDRNPLIGPQPRMAREELLDASDANYKAVVCDVKMTATYGNFTQL